jgi:hypothetical protein
MISKFDLGMIMEIVETTANLQGMIGTAGAVEMIVEVVGEIVVIAVEIMIEDAKVQVAQNSVTSTFWHEDNFRYIIDKDL